MKAKHLCVDIEKQVLDEDPDLQDADRDRHKELHEKHEGPLKEEQRAGRSSHPLTTTSLTASFAPAARRWGVGYAYHVLAGYILMVSPGAPDHLIACPFCCATPTGDPLRFLRGRARPRQGARHQ